MSLPRYSINQYVFLHNDSCYFLDNFRQYPRLNTNFVDFFIHALRLKYSNNFYFFDHTSLSLLFLFKRQGRPTDRIIKNLEEEIYLPSVIPLLKDEHWLLLVLRGDQNHGICEIFDSFKREGSSKMIEEYVRQSPLMDLLTSLCRVIDFRSGDSFQQENGIDCGYFMLNNILQYCKFDGLDSSQRRNENIVEQVLKFSQQLFKPFDTRVTTEKESIGTEVAVPSEVVAVNNETEDEDTAIDFVCREFENGPPLENRVVSGAHTNEDTNSSYKKDAEINNSCCFCGSNTRQLFSTTDSIINKMTLDQKKVVTMGGKICSACKRSLYRNKQDQTQIPRKRGRPLTSFTRKTKYNHKKRLLGKVEDVVRSDSIGSSESDITLKISKGIVSEVKEQKLTDDFTLSNSEKIRIKAKLSSLQYSILSKLSPISMYSLSSVDIFRRKEKQRFRDEKTWCSINKRKRIVGLSFDIVDDIESFLPSIVASLFTITKEFMNSDARDKDRIAQVKISPSKIFIKTPFKLSVDRIWLNEKFSDILLFLLAPAFIEMPHSPDNYFLLSMKAIKEKYQEMLRYTQDVDSECQRIMSHRFFCTMKSSDVPESFIVDDIEVEIQIIIVLGADLNTYMEYYPDDDGTCAWCTSYTHNNRYDDLNIICNHTKAYFFDDSNRSTLYPHRIVNHKTIFPSIPLYLRFPCLLHAKLRLVPSFLYTLGYSMRVGNESAIDHREKEKKLYTFLKKKGVIKGRINFDLFCLQIMDGTCCDMFLSTECRTEVINEFSLQGTMLATIYDHMGSIFRILSQKSFLTDIECSNICFSINEVLKKLNSLNMFRKMDHCPYYTHILRIHIVNFIGRFRNIMRFCQEGHESVNKIVKALFDQNSQKGGGLLASPPNKIRIYNSSECAEEDLTVATLFSICYQYHRRVRNFEVEGNTRKYIKRNVRDDFLIVSDSDTKFKFVQEDWLFEGIESTFKFTMDRELLRSE